jgi:hypothetical protein
MYDVLAHPRLLLEMNKWRARPPTPAVKNINDVLAHPRPPLKINKLRARPPMPAIKHLIRVLAHPRLPSKILMACSPTHACCQKFDGRARPPTPAI